MLNAEEAWLARCLYMTQKRLTPSGKPYDIHERLLDFACDIVNAVQFLHTRGLVARAFSYQLLSAGTSTGANAEESDGASSHNDFIAKNRIALRKQKKPDSDSACAAAAVFSTPASIHSSKNQMN
jgi:hypothetical protein